MALTLKHQTLSAFLERVRRKYDAAEGERAAQIALRMTELLAAGDIADGPAQSAWGLSSSDWKKLKDEWKALHDALKKLKEKKAK